MCSHWSIFFEWVWFLTAQRLSPTITHYSTSTFVPSGESECVRNREKSESRTSRGVPRCVVDSTTAVFHESHWSDFNFRLTFNMFRPEQTSSAAPWPTFHLFGVSKQVLALRSTKNVENIVITSSQYIKYLFEMHTLFVTPHTAHGEVISSSSCWRVHG